MLAIARVFKSLSQIGENRIRVLMGVFLLGIISGILF